VDLQGCYKNKKVFVTGHTGFKGSWLSLWLSKLGASVFGYSQLPETDPSLFDLVNMDNVVQKNTIADVRDISSLQKAMLEAEPEIVFHLAAQPLVRSSYDDPLLTFSTNVMGTVNCLEAARKCPSVQSIIIVTTDKCYQNNEWAWGYRETDELGGYDPYSASKAACELVTNSYRQSFLQSNEVLVASARAGNVIGGGDWSEDRLVPDVIRSIKSSEKLIIRNPKATRPWQHVLDCLHGYLILGGHLLNGNQQAATAFNFGPSLASNQPVDHLLHMMSKSWDAFDWQMSEETEKVKHEAGYLYLDSSKASAILDWKPKWSLEECVEKTCQWYRSIYDNSIDAYDLCIEQITDFEE
jgi:CDP-glucose 4,6-dehydratase